MRPNRVLSRALVRVRKVARACVTGAVCCSATAWWCCGTLVYTGIGLVLTAATMLVTTLFAVACVVLSGGKFKPGA